MAPETESVVLEHLRHIRRGVDNLGADVAELKTRVSAIEEVQGQVLVLIGSLNKRMDRFDERLTRVERRLDIVEVQ
jgi:hypothetical protein